MELFLSLPINSAYLHLFPPLCHNPWFFSDMTFSMQNGRIPTIFSVTPEYH